VTDLATNDALWLGGVFLLAFLIEAAIGFGSTLVVVSLAAQVLPLAALLPVFQPLGMSLSITIIAREWREVDRAFLLRTVLPAMAPGLVLGMVLFRLGSADLLLLVVGVVIACLAVVELARLIKDAAPVALPPAVVRGAFVVAGVIHGLFGTSGPLVVWAASHALPEKGRFRATLSFLWLALSVVLVGGYLADGTLNPQTAVLSAKMAPALLFGYVVGNALHRSVPQRHFRFAVCVLLVVAGAALVLRAARALMES